MFMLFYASLSSISPPVAVTAFAAAAVANANPFRLMPYACKLAVGGFVLPFFFVFNPGLLMQGTLWEIVSDTAVAAAFVITCALVLHGFIRKRPIPAAVRGIFAVAALAMAIPHPAIQYGAVAFAAGLYFFLLRTEQRDPAWSR
jgi:TRAP-type uncharacterized transport system fused permease subunit